MVLPKDTSDIEKKVYELLYPYSSENDESQESHYDYGAKSYGVDPIPVEEITDDFKCFDDVITPDGKWHEDGSVQLLRQYPGHLVVELALHC